MLATSVIRFFCSKEFLNLVDNFYITRKGNIVYIGPYSTYSYSLNRLWSMSKVIKLSFFERVYLKRLLNEIP